MPPLVNGIASKVRSGDGVAVGLYGLRLPPAFFRLTFILGFNRRRDREPRRRDREPEERDEHDRSSQEGTEL